MYASLHLMQCMQAFGLSGILCLRPIHRVALVIVGCCPGGAMSNIVCFLAQADLDLSVAMTTASSLVAIVMMPLNVLIYIKELGLANGIKLDYIGIAVSAVLVIFGIGTGVFAKNWAASAGAFGARVLQILAFLGAIGGLGTTITSIVANSQSKTPVWKSEPQMYCAAFLQGLFGVILGFGAARMVGLPRPSCVAVSVETSVQNAILAMAILSITFDGDIEGQAMVVPMCYGTFTACINLIWAWFAWKVMGFTELSSGSSLFELLQAYKQIISNSNESIGGKNNSKQFSEAIEGLTDGNEIELGKVTNIM